MFTYDSKDNNEEKVIKELESIHDIPSQENVVEFKLTGVSAKLLHAIKAVSLSEDEDDVMMDCMIGYANNIYMSYKNIETYLLQTHQIDTNENEKTIRRLFIEIVDSCKQEAGEKTK